MDSLWLVLLSLGFVALVAGVWYTTTQFVSKEDKEILKKQEESLADDRVYDPETGRFFTLEELENDEKFEASKGDDLFTDDEIEKVFTYDDSYPLIHNYFIQNGFLTNLEESFLVNFKQTAIANSYDDISFVHNYSISNKSVVSIMQLEYKARGDYYSEEYFIGVVNLKRAGAHFLLEPVSIREGLFNLIDSSKSKVIDGWNLVAFNAEPDDIFVDDIIAVLPKNSLINRQLIDDPENVQVAVEVKENRLYFKSMLPINADDVSGVISIIKNLEGI
ncbi:MAG: hypothetical protein ACI8ZM_003304 [Crocinitomix sp.]|jgi:hypothetical protein